ncbi:Asp-tRNA(Asn)/Glu-tRNA(Gln) amidotransferase subunit GatC [Patescibacteria group bacterium]|nr:Asp-tRNA(Asn)/Glu-tRNA(Gln) amidotransferase subunit GatC [Patescibacteria group bacterium]
MLTKKELEHLADLARIELKEGEEAKLQHDLDEVLEYFKELQVLDTETVAPMTGGTDVRNALRDDASVLPEQVGKGPAAFPEKHDGYLKVPPIL